MQPKKWAKMVPRELQVGDICQIRPEYGQIGQRSHIFGGMLLVVTEPKTWGAMGYLMSPYNFEATKYKGRAYLRVKFEDMEYVGRLEWILDDKESEEASDL